MQPPSESSTLLGLLCPEDGGGFCLELSVTVYKSTGHKFPRVLEYYDITKDK